MIINGCQTNKSSNVMTALSREQSVIKDSSIKKQLFAEGRKPDTSCWLR